MGPNSKYGAGPSEALAPAPAKSPCDDMEKGEGPERGGDCGGRRGGRARGSGRGEAEGESMRPRDGGSVGTRRDLRPGSH